MGREGDSGEGVGSMEGWAGVVEGRCRVGEVGGGVGVGDR